jgi:hypothetical protein
VVVAAIATGNDNADPGAKEHAAAWREGRREDWCLQAALALVELADGGPATMD